MEQITKDIEVETLIELVPETLSLLIAKGICGIRCGETISGSLNDVALEKGFSGNEIEKIVFALNELIKQKENAVA